MGNLVTEAFSGSRIAVSRTRERGPSAPTMIDPDTSVPSEKAAITPLPLSLKATSTRHFPYYSQLVSSFGLKKCIYSALT